MGFQKCYSEYSVFIHKTSSDTVILSIYVDNILLIVSDVDAIEKTKEYFKTQFVIEGMGMPKYFLEIEIAYSKHRVLVSQQKYTLNLLQKNGLIGCKPVHTPMNTDTDLWDDTGPLFEDVSQYKRFVGKLIYLSVTRHDIAYVVGLVSQFMHTPREIHQKTNLRILTYIKLGKGLLYKNHGHLQIEAFLNSNHAGKKERNSTQGYCTCVRDNLVTQSKKQSVVSRSSTETENRAMTHIMCEMM